MADKIKLLAAFLLLSLGIAGFYYLSAEPSVVRVLSVLVGAALAVAVAYFTEPGRAFYGFSRESVAEARKVVWPTRKETIQMTGVVILFVLVLALFMWGVDGILFSLLHLVMGRSV